MASSLSAHLRILLECDATPADITFDATARQPKIDADMRWSQGTGSAQVDREFFDEVTLGIGATQTYDLLAAGGLTDIHGQAIDADELKALVIQVTSGGPLKIDAPAANFLGIFTDASDLLNVSDVYAQRFGAAGLDVTVNSKFNVVDLGAGCTYRIGFIVAQ